MKKCPFCAEDIQDEAIKCKHCLSMLDHPGQRTAVDKMVAAGETMKAAGNNISRLGCGLTFLFTFPILGFVVGGFVGLVFGSIVGLICLVAMIGSSKK